MATHDLKTWPEYFADVAAGVKRVEIRLDDRGYAVGDVLHLREWTPPVSMEMADSNDFAKKYGGGGKYTGRTCDRTVTHCLRGMPWALEGYVAMSLAEVPSADAQVTQEQRAELARLAEAADASSHEWYDVLFLTKYGDQINVDDMPFIEACSPPTVLALISALATAEAERDAARERAAGFGALVDELSQCGYCPDSYISGCVNATPQMASCDNLRTKLECLMCWKKYAEQARAAATGGVPGGEVTEHWHPR